MNKLQKVLSILQEQDLLENPRESRLGIFPGFAIDLSAISDPDAVQSEMLAKWFERLNEKFSGSDLDSEEYWNDEGHVGGGVITLAWYQPLTYYRADAGIFITDYGIWKYAREIKRGDLSLDNLIPFPTPADIPTSLCISLAIELLLLHETFHHDVEWFTLKLNTIHSEHFLYRKYDEQVYLQSNKLEEALASARMQTGLSTAANRGKFSLVLKLTLEYLESRAANQPMGYNQANLYNTAQTHALGRRVLAASINQLNPSPKVISVGSTTNIGKGYLSDYFRENVVLVPISTTGPTVAPPNTMAFSVPASNIRRLLAKYGYAKTVLGKGSHEVWEHPARPSITLPSRREFEGYQVLTNIRVALGFGSLHELREAASMA